MRADSGFRTEADGANHFLDLGVYPGGISVEVDGCFTFVSQDRSRTGRITDVFAKIIGFDEMCQSRRIPLHQQHD